MFEAKVREAGREGAARGKEGGGGRTQQEERREERARVSDCGSR